MTAPAIDPTTRLRFRDAERRHRWALLMAIEGRARVHVTPEYVVLDVRSAIAPEPKREPFIFERRRA